MTHGREELGDVQGKDGSMETAVPVFSDQVHEDEADIRGGVSADASELPSNIANPASDLILLSLHTPHEYRPRIAWFEDGQVKSKALARDLKNAVGSSLRNCWTLV